MSELLQSMRAGKSRMKGRRPRSLFARDGSPPSPLGPNAPRPTTRAVRAMHLLVVAALVGFSVYDWRVRFPGGQAALQQELDALQGGARISRLAPRSTEPDSSRDVAGGGRLPIDGDSYIHDCGAADSDRVFSGAPAPLRVCGPYFIRLLTEGACWGVAVGTGHA